MKNRTALLLLALVVFVDMLGFGMVIPVMALYAEKLGAPVESTGWLSTLYSLMQLVFAPIWGRLSDRIGRRPVLLVSIAMTALAFLFYGLAGSFAMLLLSRLFAGAATANIAIAQAYVADVTPPEERARGMGVLGAALGMGFVFGPAIGGLLSAHSLALPGLAAAGLSALNLVGAFLLLPEPESRSASPVSQRRLSALLGQLARPGVGQLIVIFFLAVGAFSAMESTYAFLAKRRFGLRDQDVAYVFTYIGVLVAITQGVLIGPLTRWLGEKRLLVAGAALQAAGLAWLPFAEGVSGLLLASAPLAVGSGLASPAMASLLSRLAPDEAQGGTLGVGQSASALGRIVGPKSGTSAFAWWQPSPYLGGAAIMALAAVVGLTLRSERRDPV